MPKYLRSTLAQFRCGIIPIRIETGRFQEEPIGLKKEFVFFVPIEV